ncbi:hypothetical protein QQF64_008096, partial [Cirrhinus molitorella]
MSSSSHTPVVHYCNEDTATTTHLVNTVKIEIVKVEIEDMSDPEPSRIKDEDTEEQI